MQILDTFSVSNFKSFSAQTTIEVRPLTVLFGYNSAGKSSLLRTLPFLGDCFSYNGDSPMDLRSDAMRGASFKNLVCHRGSGPSINFSLSWKGGAVKSIDFSVIELSDEKRIVVERLIITDFRDQRITFEWDLANAKLYPNRYLASIDDSRFWSVDLLFKGLSPELVQIPSANEKEELPAALREAMFLVEFATRPFSRQMTWLKALRDVPPRWEVTRGPGIKIKPNGDGAVQLLAMDGLSGGKALSLVSSWYEEATGHTLVLRRGAFQEDELLSVGLSRMGSAFSSALADTGEGMAQVFPIVAYLALFGLGDRERGGVLAVEHPELHLHPAAHGHLAGLFCDAARRGMVSSIVETHSENFLLRVQLEIAEGRLNPNVVALYWIGQDDGGAFANKIEFDKLGRPVGDNWPPGVFSENIEQARQLAAVRRRKSTAAHENNS
ncbi:hypothetical protein CK215_22085 [Mesorhizobium sp. WSM3864]|uniref:AAA family ATPase n=1 Tax=Mesorhizobium sp. WSM3864 TaxID=2029404 RepID=UPI000BAE77B5|nr:AAA family ATPase [Mesorhizobium sp. WSM3864]PBB90345.1 hypothetical protein CK215_22085 [Mesorhizobium sp. WSM3864]